MGLTWRDTIRRISPPWLQRGNAEKILYAVAIQYDALTDVAVAAIKARFPGLYTPESLPLIGRERKIRRGRDEPASTYATRLTRWLDDHLTRGGPYALLAQLHAFYAANPFRIDLIYRSGRRYSMDASGTVTRDDVPWAPDTEPEKWARWWLFFHWPEDVPLREWGDGAWGDSGTWGSGLTTQDVESLKLIPTEWNAEHCLGTLVLLFGGHLLWGHPPEAQWGDPGLTWGAGGKVELPIK